MDMRHIAALCLVALPAYAQQTDKDLKPGKYGYAPFGPGKVHTVSVEEPLQVGSDMSVRTLSATEDADLCTVPFNATWFTGNLTNSRVGSQLDEQKIAFPVYSYGILGPPGSCGTGKQRPMNRITGLSQIGGSLNVMRLNGGKVIASVTLHAMR